MLQHPDPQFFFLGGGAVVVSGELYVLYITETCKFCRLLQQPTGSGNILKSDQIKFIKNGRA